MFSFFFPSFLYSLRFCSFFFLFSSFLYLWGFTSSGYLRNPRAGCHCNGKWPGATPRRTSSLPTYEAQMKKKQVLQGAIGGELVNEGTEN